MRQHILATALAAAVTALAYGQNLNPTVEVTNAYEGGASSINKPAEKMAVPDSVTRFNLDFDYSVFEKPYQGAYEFTPYYVQLKPAPKASTTEKFYLKTGAGFTLHPELDLVWSPLQKEKFRVNVYATHHSYFGKYHDFTWKVDDNLKTWIVPSGEKDKGYLADSKAGVDAAYGWDGGIATLDVGFRHRMASLSTHLQRMGGLEAKGRVRSLPSDEPHFLYDAAITYSLMGGGLAHQYYSFFAPDPSLAEDPVVVNFLESQFNLDGTFGPVLNEQNRFLVDLDLDLARYAHGFNGYTGLLSATPKYQFETGRWRFSLGARIAAIIYSEGFNAWDKEYQRKSGTIFPDVYVDFSLLDDQLVLQASATGGDEFSSLSNRFFTRPFSYEFSNLYGHSMERFRLMAGVRGNIASRFRYDLQGGLARRVHSPVDGILHNLPVRAEDGVKISTMIPVLWERTFYLWYADFDYGWKSEYVTVDGRFSYRHTKDLGYGTFNPAAFTGFIRPAYNWGERFKGGLDVSWSTSRKLCFTEEDYQYSTEYIPGWVDLGVFAEYRFTHRLGFWAKGGNLLNQVVQRTPLVAEAGMYFTAGIVLNF